MGHTFHANRHELHGITVVIDAPGGRTWVGRFHEQDERGVHLVDAVEHQAGGEQSRDEFLRRIVRFGVRVEHKHVLLKADDVGAITRLGELRLD